MPATPPNRTSTAGVILLVEEYDALAIAFSSALKKIAPQYETRVVRSLREAEALLAELRPTLLVLDCDPPPRGAVRFFMRLRSALPNARVLIIAAENAEELLGNNTNAATLQFFKKPFDLAKLGATIQSLLTQEGARAGDLTLADLVLFYAVTAPTIVLRVDAPDGRSGEIHLADGRIVHAAVLGKSGVQALQEILRWRSPRITEAERPIDAPRSISGAWPSVLHDALLSKAVPEAAPEPLRRAERNAAPANGDLEAPEPPQKRILIVDDTELLLVFLEETLATAHPELEISTAQTGEEGLRAAIATKPDLILLDYSLPDVTGATVCERLLADETTARIPVLMMSGHVPEMSAAAEEFENIVGTIAKPFLSAAMIDLVERTLSDPPRVRRRRKKSERVKKEDTSQRQTPQTQAAGISVSEIEEKEPQQIEEPVGLAEEVLPPSIVSEPEQPAAPPPPRAAAAETVSLPTEIKTARQSAVILALPLEVVSLRISSALRVSEIVARPFSRAISLHVLPKAGAATAPPYSAFALGSVTLDSRGTIETVRVAPITGDAARSSERYRLAIDGVAMVAETSADMLRVVPTAIAPMRFELMALFQPARVELSENFTVDELVLTARDERMRVTLLPEAAHVGATFRIAEATLDANAMLMQVRLVAVS